MGSEREGWVEVVVRMDTGAGRACRRARYRRVVPVDGTEGAMGGRREQRDVPGGGKIIPSISARVKESCLE